MQKSLRWVYGMTEEDMDMLSSRTVACPNVDMSMFGPGSLMLCGATPQLDERIKEASRMVPDPDGPSHTLYGYMIRQNPPMDCKSGRCGTDFATLASTLESLHLTSLMDYCVQQLAMLLSSAFNSTGMSAQQKQPLAVYERSFNLTMSEGCKQQRDHKRISRKVKAALSKYEMQNSGHACYQLHVICGVIVSVSGRDWKRKTRLMMTTTITYMPTFW
ncbi:uncharacterized protein LOC119311499 [Triticum dicoccoides]|uniref:uncharacterized protein LOC119311499 n=1 Tax=Triticum dicoccoides TaxID=85692 RepID=UPI0018918459|nr:uncharacterized protein LOC119311499 [Triticum dicoccoides]